MTASIYLFHGNIADAGWREMDDEMKKGVLVGNLRHVLDVGEDRVFQTVAGVRPTTAFSGAQVFSEPGNKIWYTLIFRQRICIKTKEIQLFDMWHSAGMLQYAI